MIAEEKFKTQNHKIIRIAPYIIIVAAVFTAWFPALGDRILIADEYPFTLTLNNGLYAYFANWLGSQFGVFRILGQIINGIITHHPVLSSYLAVFTHILTVVLFFEVSQILLKSIGLALVIALTMGVFPWGCETILHVMGYTPILAATLFWLNLLILLRFTGNKKRQLPIFIISYFLTLITQLIYENIVFSFMVSGLIVWIDEDSRKFQLGKFFQNVRNNFSGLAPFVGSLTYLIAHKITFPASQAKAFGRAITFNLSSIFSTYYYQYTNYFIFEPWFTKTRNLIFYSWDLSKVLIFLFLLLIIIASLDRYFKQGTFENPKTQVSNGLLIYILLLLLGGSLIYVFAGGYSIDTRKKYALIPFILLFFAWIWRRFLEPKFKFQEYQSQQFIAVLMTLGLFGISTSWLVTGAYFYEFKRHDALAEFIVANNITGDVQIDLERGWSNIDGTLGFGMYSEDWVLNLAIKAKRDRLCCKIIVDKEWIKQDPYSIRVSNNPDAVKLSFNSQQSNWQIVRP
jgi:hypothetical protein